MPKAIANLLFEYGIEVAPRLIGEQDRNVASPTCGYFGRPAWAWRTTPPVDAASQYAIYYLALLWGLDDDRNPYRNRADIREAIVDGVRCWCTLQKPDGSFDQSFLNERSVGATHYTLQAVLAVEAMLGDTLSADVGAEMTRTIERAGNFILDRQEKYGVVSNHQALFALTFDQMWRRTGDSRYRRQAEESIATVLHHASPEGWFLEYNGADPGYQTQCLHYLARLLDLGYDVLDVPVREAVIRFMPCFFHPDGSVGGHYGARGAMLCFPGGLATLAPRYPEARAMLAAAAEGWRGGACPVPAALDFPNAVRLAVNFLEAARTLGAQDTWPRDETTLPWQRDNAWIHFREAGLTAIATPTYYAVAATHKGGAVKLFDKATRSLIIDDSGYFAAVDGVPAATLMQSAADAEVDEAGRRVFVTAPFFRMRLSALTPLTQAALLLLGMTIFRLGACREAFKRFLVRHLITAFRPTAASCSRALLFEDGRVLIRDRMNAGGAAITYLNAPRRVIVIHAASTGYDQPYPAAKLDTLLIDKATPAGLTIETEIHFPFDGRASRRILPGNGGGIE